MPSGKIIGVGNRWERGGNSWVGLMGQRGGHAKYMESAVIGGQFVVDEGNWLWFFPHHISLWHSSVKANIYPMIFRISRESYNWDPGHGTPSSPWAFAFWPSGIEINNSTPWAPVDSGIEVEFSWSGQQSDSYYFTEEQARAGRVAREDEGWMIVGQLNTEIPKQWDGYHIWFGGRSYYDQEDDVVNPIPFEFVFNYTEIPTDYYPCNTMQSNQGAWVPCNDPGHNFKIMPGDKQDWRDAKNREGSTVDWNTDHGLIMRADHPADWSKIKRGW